MCWLGIVLSTTWWSQTNRRPHCFFCFEEVFGFLCEYSSLCSAIVLCLHGVRFLNIFDGYLKKLVQ